MSHQHSGTRPALVGTRITHAVIYRLACKCLGNSGQFLFLLHLLHFQSSRKRAAGKVWHPAQLGTRSTPL